MMVSAVLGTQSLRTMVWGWHTAEYTAILSMCMSLIAMGSAGMFGRFGDRAGRRVAAAVFGLASFLPSWSLVVCGFNATGLYANSAAFLLSGVGLCSDALLVLASDVTREGDRGMAFGLFQAATNAIAFLLFGLPSLFTVLLKVVPNPPIEVCLWYSFILTLVYFVLVYSVRMPAEAVASPKDPSPPMSQCTTNDDCSENGSDLDATLEAGNTPSTNDSEGRPSSRPCPESAPADCPFPVRAWRLFLSMPLVHELKMISDLPNLRRLYIAGVLLFFSGDVVFDLGSQYFRENLGLMPEHGLEQAEKVPGMLEHEQLVSVLTTLPPEIGIVPGAMLVGSLAKRLGSLRLLRWMIPVAALMTASGVVMRLVPRYWMVPIICLCLNYASLAANIPLKHLIIAAAPEGRVGEAMATFGMLNQAVGFTANAFVAASTPVLYTYLKKPLWIVYVIAGVLTLLGSIPVRRLESDESAVSDGGKGTAAAKEQTEDKGVTTEDDRHVVVIA